MRTVQGIKTVVAGMLMLNFSLADASETPTTLAGGRLVSAAEANALVGKAHFFDMRKALNFGKGHVKGAVPLPYEGKSENAVNFNVAQDTFDRSRLPADKKTSLVFYSDGPGGWKSYKAAVHAIRAGYTNVMWMRGGMTEWEAKGFEVD